MASITACVSATSASHCSTSTSTEATRRLHPKAALARPSTSACHVSSQNRPTTVRLHSSFIPSHGRAAGMLQQQHRRAARSGRACVCAASDADVEEELMMVEEGALERMEKTLESVRGNFNTVRTGRAAPSLLDRIEVEYYGATCILKSIAQIAAPEASMLLVTPFDKSSIPSIEKAIMKSDVGLTPSSDGNVIRLAIPQLTAERRKELLKTVSRLAEDGKVALRNVRRDSIKQYEKMEKDKKISEDACKDLSDAIQKMTDDYVKQIDTIFKAKEKDLLTV